MVNEKFVNFEQNSGNELDPGQEWNFLTFCQCQAVN